MASLVGVGDNDVSVYINTGTAYAGGNCVNVPVYIRMNGGEAGYVGVIGSDLHALIFQNALRAYGVDISRLRTAPGLTSGSNCDLVEGDRVFGYYEERMQQANPLALDSTDIDYIKKYDVIHSSIYSVLADGTLEKLRAAGPYVSYDFSLEWDAAMLEKVCPFVDFAFMSCSHLTPAQTEEMLRHAVKCGARLAVGTRGTDGSLLFDGGEFYRQKAYLADTVDTLGAGDSYIARFLYAYVDGLKFFDECAGRVGSYAAADEQEFLDSLTRYAMSSAAAFATRNCQHNGAFGMGFPSAPYVDPNV